MSSTHIACLRILLLSTRDDNLVKETLNKVDDYRENRSVSKENDISLAHEIFAKKKLSRSSSHQKKKFCFKKIRAVQIFNNVLQVL